MLTYDEISDQIRDEGLGGWLVYSFRSSNPVLGQLLQKDLMLTRRALLLLRPDTKPVLLVSRVDATAALDEIEGVDVERYTTWQQYEGWLETNVAPLGRVAMEYSPSGALPAMSWADAGTVDLIRRFGVEVVSSAELFQRSAAALSTASLESHRRAMTHVVNIKDAAFARVAQQLRAGETPTEAEIQTFIQAEFERHGLVTDDPPIVAVNGHSGDPHYAPSASLSSGIRAGDYLLIDLWAKETGHDAVFADITWVGFLGASAPDHYHAVFDVVARARDAVIAHIAQHGPTAGYELDRAARAVIESAGYGDQFVHRTGHSLSPGESVHGLGAHLDDLETHDTRIVGNGLAFTVEPGIYLPEFGIRLEINAYMNGVEPVVTAPVQTAPLLFDV